MHEPLFLIRLIWNNLLPVIRLQHRALILGDVV